MCSSDLGGLPVPAIGASDFGLKVAEQFGLGVITPRPALVPLTFAADTWAPFAALSGIALPVGISSGTGKARTTFLEDLLFTHRGLSGPADRRMGRVYHRDGTNGHVPRRRVGIP